MSDKCIQEVFRSTVLAKLVYASPGWASTPQVTATNWTDLLTDANVSVTAIRHSAYHRTV